MIHSAIMKGEKVGDLTFPRGKAHGCEEAVLMGWGRDWDLKFPRGCEKVVAVTVRGVLGSEGRRARLREELGYGFMKSMAVRRTWM